MKVLGQPPWIIEGLVGVLYTRSASLQRCVHCVLSLEEEWPQCNPSYFLFQLSGIYGRYNCNVVEALGKGIWATGGQLKTWNHNNVWKLCQMLMPRRDSFWHLDSGELSPQRCGELMNASYCDIHAYCISNSDENKKWYDNFSLLTQCV